MAGSGVLFFLFILVRFTFSFHRLGTSPAPFPSTRLRCGTSLVELLIFIGIFAVSAGVLITVLAASNEQRVRQQTIAAVEQEGMQLLQMLLKRTRRAERVVLPPAGSTGSVVALQIADTSQDPTIIALQTGAIVAAESSTVRILSSNRVTVGNLIFRNTSSTGDRQSLHFSFTVSADIPLPQDVSYSRKFETLVVLFPDDDLSGNACGCSAPVCSDGVLTWGVCDGETCSAAEGSLPCE